MKPHEELRRAAQIIREQGWARGTFQDYCGRVCISGACGVAIHGLAMMGMSTQAMLFFYQACNEYPTRFNDVMCLCEDDAAAALEIAADLATPSPGDETC